MKITVISDTHGGHEELGQLGGDVLIHCGDFENLFRSDDQALKRLDDWFGRQDFEHILCTGGNHDLTLEARAKVHNQPFQNAAFLQDRELVIKGIKFFGAPWVPDLKDHAFYADSAALIRAWSKIPEDVDVLITHVPPAGILDRSSRGDSLGCGHLAEQFSALRPKLHCFGHVHASSGRLDQNGTTYVNATSVNSDIEISVPPFECEITPTGLQQLSKAPSLWWPFIR